MLRNLALILLVTTQLSACESSRQSIEISFSVTYAGEEISCSGMDSSVALTDMRVYIHDLFLIDQEGKTIPVEFVPDDLWQDYSVALLDFEDGSGSCINGTGQTNHTIRGSYVATNATLDGLTFRIGLPENINHNDPTVAAPPLNYTSMHWQWASGYKFLSAGIETGTDGFWLHLGSSRCAGTIGNIEGCKSSNRPSVSLAGFDPGAQFVTIDLARLFDSVNLADGVKSDCSSGPIEASCAEPFEALGISSATGKTFRNTSVFGISR